MSHRKGDKGVYNLPISAWYYPNINCGTARIKNFLIRKFLEASQKPHVYHNYDCSGALYVWIVHGLPSFPTLRAAHALLM